MTTMTAAIYARSNGTNADASIRDQILRCQEYLAENGEIETCVYSDVATGSNAFVRGGFNAMVKECLEGQVAYIVCASLDRLSRSPADFPTIERLVSRRQIALIALDRIDIIKEGPGSKV